MMNEDLRSKSWDELKELQAEVNEILCERREEKRKELNGEFSRILHAIKANGFDIAIDDTHRRPVGKAVDDHFYFTVIPRG